MVMGVCVLLITTLISRIGTKNTFSFISGVAPADIIALNDEIEQVCRQRGTERALMRKMQIAMDSLCETVYEAAPEAQLQFVITYDPQQIRMHIESQNVVLAENLLEQENNNFEVCMMVLKHMFEDVKIRIDKGCLVIDLNADL
jgi:hypothetical protein